MNLIIELEGSIHDCPDQRKYDEGRFEELSGHGFKVLRIRNEDVLNDIESVLQRILEVIAQEDPHPKPWNGPVPSLLGRGVRGEANGDLKRP
jgi:5-methyltetrahydrofolate--homocysteine methyltransferase